VVVHELFQHARRKNRVCDRFACNFAFNRKPPLQVVPAPGLRQALSGRLEKIGLQQKQPDLGFKIFLLIDTVHPHPPMCGLEEAGYPPAVSLQRARLAWGEPPSKALGKAPVEAIGAIPTTITPYPR